jgi:hypothetical protein
VTAFCPRSVSRIPTRPMVKVVACALAVVCGPSWPC